MIYKNGERMRDFLGLYIFIVVQFSVFWGAFLTKQLFHSRLLDIQRALMEQLLFITVLPR